MGTDSTLEKVTQLIKNWNGNWNVASLQHDFFPNNVCMYLEVLSVYDFSGNYKC